MYSTSYKLSGCRVNHDFSHSEEALLSYKPKHNSTLSQHLDILSHCDRCGRIQGADGKVFCLGWGSGVCRGWGLSVILCTACSMPLVDKHWPVISISSTGHARLFNALYLRGLNSTKTHYITIYSLMKKRVFSIKWNIIDISLLAVAPRIFRQESYNELHHPLLTSVIHRYRFHF